MQKPMDYEPEIDLKDLFFHVLYHWRSCLTAALIGALLLGSFQFISLEKIHREGKLTDEEKQYEIDLQAYQNNLKNTQKNIDNYTKLLAELEEYEENSVWLHFDASNEWVAIKTWQVNLNEEELANLPVISTQDPVDNILAVYSSSLFSDLEEETLEAVLGSGKKEYYSELVKLSVDNTVNTITLQILNESREKAEKAIAFFEERLTTVCYEKAKESISHTLLLVGNEIFVTSDNQLNAKQRELNEKVVEYQKNLQENKILLNSLEEEGSEPAVPGKHLVRFAVIGCFLGGILLVIIHLAKYVFSGLLHLSEELTDCYGISLYGSLFHSRARKPGKGIDKIIEKMENKHETIDENLFYANICALIRENCNTKELLLAGTISEEKMNIVREKLQSLLTDQKIIQQSNFVHNASAISLSKEAQAVLWVEEKHVSSIKEIDRMADILDINNSKVCGCIMI